MQPEAWILTFYFVSMPPVDAGEYQSLLLCKQGAAHQLAYWRTLERTVKWGCIRRDDDPQRR